MNNPRRQIFYQRINPEPWKKCKLILPNSQLHLHIKTCCATRWRTWLIKSNMGLQIRQEMKELWWMRSLRTIGHQKTRKMMDLQVFGKTRKSQIKQAMTIIPPVVQLREPKKRGKNSRDQLKGVSLASGLHWQLPHSVHHFMLITLLGIMTLRKMWKWDGNLQWKIHTLLHSSRQFTLNWLWNILWSRHWNWMISFAFTNGAGVAWCICIASCGTLKASTWKNLT